MLPQTPPRVVTQCPSRVVTQRPPRVLTQCPPRVLTRCFPNSCQSALCTCPECILLTYCSVAVILYTRTTEHCGHRTHRSHCSHCSSLSSSEPSHRQEASQSCASWNRRPQSIGWPDPGCVCNTSGTLRPRLCESPQFDCYRLIVVENCIRIVVAPGHITCGDEPVETID
jgi:hypothetical protein